MDPGVSLSVSWDTSSCLWILLSLYIHLSYTHVYCQDSTGYVCVTIGYTCMYTRVCDYMHSPWLCFSEGILTDTPPVYVTLILRLGLDLLFFYFLI